MIDEPHHAAWRPPSVRHRYRSRTLCRLQPYFWGWGPVFGIAPGRRAAARV